MSDASDSSSDEEQDENAAAMAGYSMMMPYGYAYPSAYGYAAYAPSAYPAGFGYPAAYPGYGTADYAAYMQMQGYATGSATGTGKGSGTPGIAADPMSAYGSGYGQSFQYGTVKTFLPEKGFGFIESAIASEGDVFFSKTELSSDLQSESQKDLKGKPVQFEVTLGKDNRSRAINVQLSSLELVQWAAKNAPKPKGTPSSGTIKSFSERHGYGFLALENGTADAQFRGSDLSPELAALGSALAGRMVKCQIHELADGKVKATDMVPIPGQAGKGKSGKGKNLQALQRVQGKVKNFNPDTRLGTATCEEKSGDVTFFDLKNLPVSEGAEVSFLLKILADGSAQGMDLCLGDSDANPEPVPLRDGTTITATVKSFNDTRGFGFLKIPGANMDLYFHGRDMDEASQGLLMLVGANGLANCNATCRVEARADGRWNGRNVSLLEAGVQMMDGMKMAGMIRYFYDHKGFGFINVTGNPIDIYFQGRDVGPDAQTRCEEMGAVGTVVWFTVYAQTDSRWQAKDIVLAGDGSSPGGLTAEMLGGKGWGKGDEYSDSYGWDGWDGWDGWGSGGSMDYGGKGSGKGGGKPSLPKVEKQIIPGCELVGKLKSYNVEKNFGFISVDGQPNDVYFQVWDLVESLKSQVESLGADGSGLSAGALVKFSLQLMPGGGRLRARDMSLGPNAVLSTATAVEAAVQKAAAVAHEAIIPGTGSILYDGAEVSGRVRTFNQDRGFGFITVDADETDLYFTLKDLVAEDQQKVANGHKLPGSRVWFWAEMLDGSSGRWKCHDISLSLRRPQPQAAPAGEKGGAAAGAPPAKRQKTEGPGQKVNGST